MHDVPNLNPDRDSRSGGAKGIKRSKSMTEILFNKEHLEPTGASSSQLRDSIMSARKDDSKNQINAMECRERLVAPLHDAQVKIWEGTWSEDTIADLMRTSEVASSETILKDRTYPQKITLSCGLTGVWKPKSCNEEESLVRYQSEIAAYQVDKLLGLNIVPLTVGRKINGERGSLQLWVNNIYDKCDKGDQHLIDKAGFFCALIEKDDCLVANGGCHNSGFIGMGSDRRIVLFDHVDTFRYYKKVALSKFIKSFVRSSFQLSEGVLEQVRHLDTDKLKNIQYLDEEQKERFLQRGDDLVKIIDGRPSQQILRLIELEGLPVV